LDVSGAVFVPAGQTFEQEVVWRVFEGDGEWSARLSRPVQLIDLGADGAVRVFTEGEWIEWREGTWRVLSDWASTSAGEFVVAAADGRPVRVRLPWREVRQVVRQGDRLWVATEADPYLISGNEARSLGWPSRNRVRQVVVDSDGVLWVASSGGLFRQVAGGWGRVAVTDGLERDWGTGEVLGAAFDGLGRLWAATRAGVACRERNSWRFYEGKDGLPWNDFTGMTAGRGGEVWLGTRLGAVWFDGVDWHYRQGPRWLPQDEVRQVRVDAMGRVWLGTAGGLGVIERRPMTLADKAAFYEDEIARYIKRTTYGFVAEAALRRPGDRASADPQDSDNDGLWTAMYGAGQCFAFGATGDLEAKSRARKAFEALRFLQEVTQGGERSPPVGYVARTVRPVEWPDPNVGRLERDRAEQRQDRRWKVIDPRWPRSADGRWFWKTDTSSDELDGHYFLYGLYYELCADTEAERGRVRVVVRELTDHLIEHGFALQDHDGQPTRWAVFGPAQLNGEADWWPERGLNSLSLLSYLAVAGWVTGDPKYVAVSRDLIDRHGYAQNAMYPKVQQGAGSGNQSDDEMAFMCYYTLLRYTRDEVLKGQIRWSFFRYWANESPELNPLFNFLYAAHGLGALGENPWGWFALDPWGDWLGESMATLRGFPLDRLNWPHRNSHRLDVERLRPPAVRDIYEFTEGRRGHRVGGRVLPVENRHFNHWNTDPWQLDYGGGGHELAAGTVFLLPYYAGLFHGFIEKP
jgi:hypothetical protein